MKNLLLITLLISVSTLYSCQPKDDYKKARTEVIKIHDDVMVSTELAMSRKMSLDTLAGRMDSLYRLKLVADTVSELKQLNLLRERLSNVDDEMNDWMHSFQPELDGRTNEEAIRYFNAEKVKIQSIDSLYHQVLQESNTYLTKFRK